MNHIDISSIIQDFNYHVQCNKNIILSGPFGSGKSYMLNEFKKVHKKQYNTITIYPLNYAISGNADILEYIKRDIIFQLVLQGFINEQTDFSAVSSAIFTEENIVMLSKGLLANIPGGGLIAEAIHIGLKAKEKYDNEKKTVSKYLSEFNRSGSIYECDTYTEIIRLGLEAGRKEGKQWILIIEDLDRIDPQNIFRLLNIFGSHLDNPYITGADCQSNKFGFDKIIFVLDYKQTYEVYSQYYGLDASTSWEGYISKFLTSTPFYFMSVADTAKSTVLRCMSQDCELQEDLLKLILSQDFSMRMLSKVKTDHFDTFLRTERIDFPDGSYISTKCKLSKLLFYFTQLNVSITNLNNISEDAPAEYIDLLAPALLLYYQTPRLRVHYMVPNRQYEELGFEFSEEDDDNAYIHYYYMISVTENGLLLIEKTDVQITTNEEIEAIDIASNDLYELLIEVLNIFCSKIVRFTVE